jgi:hypothetical protein
MPTQHLPPTAAAMPRPTRVVPLLADLGEVGGHRLVLLSLEVWDGWADLRFARIGGARPVPRRVPPAEAWEILVDGQPVGVWDAVGRGDRGFSNGEVRIHPTPGSGARLEVTVVVVPGLPPLQGAVSV